MSSMLAAPSARASVGLSTSTAPAAQAHDTNRPPARYLTGIQALVQVLFAQQVRDAADGLRTSGFVSGYRGSPLGGLDEALWAARPELNARGIRFLPGVNEELAATAVWGTQQLAQTGGSPLDGVFALWYGKGPGVDRCGDVFKHMAHAGTAPHGGVLLVAGDDHGAYSSTLPNASDTLLAACSVPMLCPSNVGEYLAFGLHGFAMSRFSGLPIGFKALADTVECSSVVDIDPLAVPLRLPAPRVEGGLNARASSAPLGQQARAQESLMERHKLEAVKAYVRENRLNHESLSSPTARLGIVASGKSHADVMEALQQLGVLDDAALRAQVRVFKVAMPWPLEPRGLAEFALGLQELLVVEEKRGLVEGQIKEQLYHWSDRLRPKVLGKHGGDAQGTDEHGWLLSPLADLTVARIEAVIAQRLQALVPDAALWQPLQQRLARVQAARERVAAADRVAGRAAWYCAGCPHNRSTTVPEGSVALAGIGCHVMATAIHPEHNVGCTQMGGEGAPWLGQAWFSSRPHLFANLGDGTYFHSGSMAVRAAVAAGVNITYKILFNDAVAMTGGQPIDGTLDVPTLVRQLAAEGVRRIALVAEQPRRWRGRADPSRRLPGLQFSLHARDELDAVQRQLRDERGVTVLIYDQVCAAEKRRRARTHPPPMRPTRAFIHEAVCEGCGDCGTQSNCTALMPAPTAFGTKRRIDQSACNTDISCVDGECPSFVTLEGARPRRRALMSLPVTVLPGPAAAPARGWNIVITGIGGTGVITLGAVLGRAAQAAGLAVSVLDMTGMSQKNGGVSCHVRLAPAGQALHAQRVPACELDLLLACDLLTAGAPEHLMRLQPGRTQVVANRHQQPTGAFAQDRDWAFPADTLLQLLREGCGGEPRLIDATALAQSLTGDTMGANLLLLGHAFQLGLVPLPAAALQAALQDHAAVGTAGLAAFQWGRHAAHDEAAVRRAASPPQPVAAPPLGIAALVESRAQALRDYAGERCAADYRGFIATVQKQAQVGRAAPAFVRAVAENLYRLTAVKDEYEVARLFTQPVFREQLARQFEGNWRLSFHFAPPLLSRRDAHGRHQKRRFGAWMWPLLALLARLRGLRGTPLDPFGYTLDRRLEQALLQDYRHLVERLLAAGPAVDAKTALELVSLPDQVRGYGSVKSRAIETVRARWAAWTQPAAAAPAAAAHAEPATAT